MHWAKVVFGQRCVGLIGQFILVDHGHRYVWVVGINLGNDAAPNFNHDAVHANTSRLI
jgi:hypothetical protein